jgi:3'-5' exoribonuclease 1
MNLDQYDYVLVLDLEATCCDRQTIKSREMEIIEIGAITIDQENLTAVSEFQTFVKPVRHPVLTDFCHNLTSISQEQVETAPTYPEAIDRLQAWLDRYPNFIFGSWGDYDRRQFKQDSKFHRIPYPINSEHINLKQRFTDCQGLDSSYGMVQALELVGLPLEGTHHRGIDDARNIVKLMPYILGRKTIKR